MNNIIYEQGGLLITRYWDGNKNEGIQITLLEYDYHQMPLAKFKDMLEYVGEKLEYNKNINIYEVKRTERGWAGHYFLGYKCLFHRNTLLLYQGINIVVSTVGNLYDRNVSEEVREITCNCYYETKVFHSKITDTEYHDMDINREISFKSPWDIAEPYRDNEANAMHEVVVEEITSNLIANKYRY